MVSYAVEQAVAKRERTVEKQIKRYAKPYQRRLRKLVKSSSRLGDLLYSFPAAAFALVSGTGDHNQRGEAIRSVKDGRDLKMIARVLGLPLWSRKLPPEAFDEPLEGLPNEEGFNRKIANLIPEEPDETALWLRWLLAARAGCHDDFALWLAKQKVAKHFRAEDPGVLNQTPIMLLATFAWFSEHEDEPAYRLMEQPWHPRMQLASAVDYMADWFDRVLLDLTRADQRRGPGRYSKRKRSSGFNLVELTSARELVEEGDAMNHCVATYASDVAQGQCRIYSVRRGKRRIATLELQWPGNRRGRPYINQLLGHSNVAVDREVYEAVTDWLAQNKNMLCEAPVAGYERHLDATRWKTFWQGYVAEKSSQVIKADRPDGYLIARLSREADILSRCLD